MSEGLEDPARQMARTIGAIGASKENLLLSGYGPSLFSIAISLKRIADMLEAASNHPDQGISFNVRNLP